VILLSGATVVNADGESAVDVLVDDAIGVVVDVRRSIDPSELPPKSKHIRGDGKYLFPGFIDPHVHVYLPFMGTFAKDTWETASRAALMGGTTTLLEMICPGKTDDAAVAYELWESHAAGHSYCDYGFHMGVTRFDEQTRSQLRWIINEKNCRSLKVFLAYKGALGIDDRELFQTMSLAAEMRVIVTGHCENETLVDQLQHRLIAKGCTAPRFHGESRPPWVEASGVRHLCAFARATGAAVYIVHTSCKEAVEAAEDEASRGVNVTIESVLPHFILDETRTLGTENDEFAGAKFVMSPPLRAEAQCQFLWEALAAGRVATVGTDHAPFDYVGQKEMGRSDFRNIPNGIPSVEHRVDLLYSRGVIPGRISLCQLVSVASEQPAKVFGLARKGRIAPGFDADLVLYDPHFRAVLSAQSHHMATDYSAFEGWETTGRSDTVMVRGRIVVEKGQWVGDSQDQSSRGWGQRVPRVSSN